MNNKTPSTLIDQYLEVRRKTMEICEPLEIEDYVVQPRPEVSPPKWHLAHTSWFFEELLLKAFKPGFCGYRDNYPRLFNSYYKSAGEHWLQSDRGSLSRPTVQEIKSYRQFVDQEMASMLTDMKGDIPQEVAFLVELGLHHEQQHQELLLMDIKSVLAANPSPPSYSSKERTPSQQHKERWRNYAESLYEFGHSESHFCYDNEKPRHKVHCPNFSISENLISNGEYLQFIEEGGYNRPELWLSQGWDWLQRENVSCPLYWSQSEGQWFEYTLYGLEALDPHSVLTHISYFEADAFANWKQARLPTEYELELFLRESADPVNEESLHPGSVIQKENSVWCWSRSQYSPYPGYKKFQGMVEEYNGKFMCNQFVLKGGCVATPKGHYRPTYRNFYEAQQRWAFTGIRLAKDI